MQEQHRQHLDRVAQPEQHEPGGEPEQVLLPQRGRPVEQEHRDGDVARRMRLDLRAFETGQPAFPAHARLDDLETIRTRSRSAG